MDAALSKKSVPIQRYINISLLQQAIIGFIGCVTIDDETAIRLVVYSALAYWITVSVIMTKRIRQLTKWDKIFISCAYPIIWILMSAFLGFLASHYRDH